MLLERQMLEKINSRPITYRTTSNGIKLMEDLKSIRSKIPEIYNLPASGKNFA